MIEEFRKEISYQVGRARDYSVNFRTAERFGLIEVNDKPVQFWFELNPPPNTGSNAMYLDSEHIEAAEEGKPFGHRGEYKYRVWGRHKLSPIHHTNNYLDAAVYLDKCRKQWIIQDNQHQNQSKSQGSLFSEQPH